MIPYQCDSLLRVHRLRYAGGSGLAGELWCDAAGRRLRPLGWSERQGVRREPPVSLLLPPELAAQKLAEVLPPGDAERNLEATGAPPVRTVSACKGADQLSYTVKVRMSSAGQVEAYVRHKYA